MAYFANGTEGLYLEAQCCECLHRVNDDVMHPISAVQTLANYDQIGNEDLTAAMNFLINEQGDQMKKGAGYAKFDQFGRRFDRFGTMGNGVG